MSIRTAIVAGLVATLAGCASHEPRAAFRRGVLIDDRGISVPLPPPSIVDHPDVDADIRGTVPGQDDLVEGTRIHVEDLQGTARASADVDRAHESFLLQGVALDVTDNCLELWLEAPDGRESDRTYVHAALDGDTIITALGCE